MKTKIKLMLFCLLLTVFACSEQADPVTDSAISLQQALGGEADASYLRADAPRNFSFPEDHGLHEGFRNEWWYLTGNLVAEDGERFGYQLTFFYLAQAPEAAPALPSDSAWQSSRIWMAHLALTDVAGNKHYAVERFTRENPGLAGAQLVPFKVWLEDWQLASSSESSLLPWQLQALTSEIGLNLTLAEGKPPVLQGDAGLSQKSASPGNASYYYSMTRLPTTGEITVGDKTYSVTGFSWMDREWSTSALDADQSGWDWFSLQFDDEQELMYYQLRNSNGTVHPYSSGSWTDTSAQQIPVLDQDISLEELVHWTSPSGITYTTEWLLHFQGKTWRVLAVRQDQWMNLSIPYWEGMVDILDAESGSSVGKGYLEMVR